MHAYWCDIKLFVTTQNVLLFEYVLTKSTPNIATDIFTLSHVTDKRINYCKLPSTNELIHIIMLQFHVLLLYTTEKKTWSLSLALYATGGSQLLKL